MARANHVYVRISADIGTDGHGETKYIESLRLPVGNGMDHVEVLAILVTEMAHFEANLRKSLTEGIKEDAVPPGY